MIKIALYLVFTYFLILLLVGCAENQSETDSYNEARDTAWNFVKEKGWNITAKDNWQSAKVTKVVIDKNYELFDKTYEGKEVLSISFEDKENSVVGTPIIIIDPYTNKVIGFMPSE
ncbi:hypothetical protein [Cytobacillus sp. IB215316]|uniref:hypothetical protein n=1 Tax=Cytobacillus sp. IB215316 TaxID=3097354 RepID=UPI002A0ED258|nr:hypothetical protein [Cytobacillus sp. IB215316]MDX8363430.1 hypothetical protein [Cytobacillus sp. IB215316]